MSRRIPFLLAAALGALGVFAVGVATGHYRSWPFDLLWQAKRTALSGDVASNVDRDARERAAIFRDLPGTAEIVMVGDSITEGGAWAERFPGCKILNRGISGDTVAGVAARMDELLARRPKRVFVMVGINDLYAGVEPSALLPIYETILRKLSARTELHLQAVFTSGPERVRSAVGDLNRRLAIAASRHGAQWHDFNPAIVGSPRSDGPFRSDGVHLNSKGYTRWSAALRPHIGTCASPR